MAWNHLKGLLFILAILWVVWFFWGAKKDTDKPFLKPPAPIDTGEKYGPQ
jgi:hypothetical protein